MISLFFKCVAKLSFSNYNIWLLQPVVSVFVEEKEKNSHHRFRLIVRWWLGRPEVIHCHRTGTQARRQTGKHAVMIRWEALPFPNPRRRWVQQLFPPKALKEISGKYAPSTITSVYDLDGVCCLLSAQESVRKRCSCVALEKCLIVSNKSVCQ